MAKARYTLLFICLGLKGWCQEVVELWPAQVPGSEREKAVPVEKPDRGDNVLRLTDVTNPTLTVFRAKQVDSRHPGIIVCPGGGYAHLAVDKEGFEIAAWFNTLGVSAFVLTYRVPDQRAGAIQDLQRAIRMVRENAARWQIDTQRVGVIGFSAGANLAVWSESQHRDHSYDVKLKDVSCHQNFTILIYPAGLDEGANHSLTPGLSINHDFPATFIFSTADDRYANSALVFAAALRNANIPVELHMMSEGGHGYGIRKGNVAAETWPLLAENWWKTLNF